MHMKKLSRTLIEFDDLDFKDILDGVEKLWKRYPSTELRDSEA